ncbi:MAG: biotin/lipoyl-containing protein, partial [Bowdeniella nasicola]|nr:biotin/lipoyl-containing protein [Bowdeniella nasicola]
MAEAVEMPALGESVTEGTVTQWLKAVGDEVAVDEPLLEVSTDKVDTEIPSPVAGVLVEILAEEDDTVEVGQVLCRIGGGDEAPADNRDQQAQQSGDDRREDAPSNDNEDGTTSDDAPKADAGSDTGAGPGEQVTMPALGESVTEGTITQWLKAEGDAVEVDEPLLEVSTDKVDTEIPSPV